MSKDPTAQPATPAVSAADIQPGQIGEGSYEGTRDYQQSLETYLDKADVAADARAAKPADLAEAEALKQAELEGLSHSRAKGQ